MYTTHQSMTDGLWYAHRVGRYATGSGHATPAAAQAEADAMTASARERGNPAAR